MLRTLINPGKLSQIFLFGTIMELITLYKNETEGDVNELNFLQWAADHTNPTISFVSEIIFNYVLPVYLFKIGVRNNDVKLIDAARFKFEDLFYAFKHPIYREVVYRDLRNRVLYPAEVRAHRDKYMSYSTTTIPSKSQGGDFILEGKVKRQKLIAPKGPIKSPMWQTLSRCLDTFDLIYDLVTFCFLSNLVQFSKGGEIPIFSSGVTTPAFYPSH